MCFAFFGYIVPDVFPLTSLVAGLDFSTLCKKSLLTASILAVGSFSMIFVVGRIHSTQLHFTQGGPSPLLLERAFGLHFALVVSWLMFSTSSLRPRRLLKPQRFMKFATQTVAFDVVATLLSWGGLFSSADLLHILPVSSLFLIWSFSAASTLATTLM